MQIHDLWALERSLRAGRGDPLTHLFALQASFVITRVFVRLGFPADVATALMFVSGCGAVALLAAATDRSMALGALLLLAAYVLDYVDGQVARFHGQSSLVGAVKDRFAHVFVEFFALAAFGVGVFRLSGSAAVATAGVVIVFWHVFRKLIADLAVLVYVEEYLSYPDEEYRVIRDNLPPGSGARGAAGTPAEPRAPGEAAAPPDPRDTGLRPALRRARLFSYNFQFFTLVVLLAAAIDLVFPALSLPPVAKTWAALGLAAYYALSMLDFARTFLFTDRIYDEVRVAAERIRRQSDRRPL